MNSYAEKLRDPRWQKKRLEVMQRDRFSCVDCGATDKTLNVHHCHYFKGGPWETPNDLLLTVCEDCHESRQMDEEDAKLALSRILAGALRRSTSKLHGGIVRALVYEAMQTDAPPLSVLRGELEETQRRHLEISSR